jgi:hypothetical protein
VVVGGGRKIDPDIFGVTWKRDFLESIFRGPLGHALGLDMDQTHTYTHLSVVLFNVRWWTRLRCLAACEEANLKHIKTCGVLWALTHVTKKQICILNCVKVLLGIRDEGPQGCLKRSHPHARGFARDTTTWVTKVVGQSLAEPLFYFEPSPETVRSFYSSVPL